MPKKLGENSKKAAGNARKAEVASQKKAAEGAKQQAEEDQQWKKGSKTNAKKEEADAKRAEAARKKAERDAQLAAEDASLPSKPSKGNAKSSQKPSRGTLDLSQLDAPASNKASALNASGIENALDALSLTGKDSSKIDRHPERRFRAAYAAFEERRLPEIEQERPGLRKQQRVDICRKEFDKSPDNPFNQAHARFDSTKEDIADIRSGERSKMETRLAK